MNAPLLLLLSLMAGLDLIPSPFTGNVFVGQSLAAAGVALPERRDGLPGLRTKDDTSVSNGIPAFWFQRGIEPGAQANIFNPYAHSVWVQRAIKKIAGPISAIELEFYPSASLQRPGGKSKRTYTKAGPGRRSPQEEIELPQVRAFLREPVRGHTYADFIEATVGWIKLRECFWVLSDVSLLPFPEQRRYDPQPILIARPDQMREVVDGGELLGWSYTNELGAAVALTPEQVIQIGYWNPYSKWRRLGELQAAHVAVEADWLAGKFSRNLNANNGDTGPFIVAKNGIPTDTQREQILMDLRQKRRAQIRGDFSPVFLTGDIEVQDPKINSVDAAFISQRLENRHEIALAFGVPPSMFDVKAAYSIGSASDAFDLILNTCIPTGAKICGALDILIARLTGQAVECSLDWDEHPVMQSVRNERFDAVGKLAAQGMPMREISDYLGLDLPEYPGWDRGLIPISVTLFSPDAMADTAAANEPGADLATVDPDQTPDASERESTESEEPLQEALLACVHLRAQKGDVAAAEWLPHMAHRRATMGLYRRAFRTALAAARSETLGKIHAHYTPAEPNAASFQVTRAGGSADLIFDLQRLERAFQLAMRQAGGQALTRGGQQLLDEIRKDDVYSMPPPKVASFLRQRENKLSGVPGEVHARIKGSLQAGYDAGDSTAQLAKRVSREFHAIDQGRGTVIAQTETAAAYGYARQDAMLANGVKYKKWLTSGAENVRPAHRDAQGEVVRVTDPFEVGGELLFFPGDPDGSPGNVINCHCVAVAVAKPSEPVS